MSTITIGVIVALILYGVVVAIISVRATKTASGNAAEYLVAGRNVGTITLLATVCLSIWSALAFYGYGAGLYRSGVGYFAGVVGGCFVGFWAPSVMYRLWLLGKRYGYTTAGDFIMHRYKSRALKIIVGIIMAVCILPYISVQVSGVANGIVTTTSGTIGFWVVVAILIIYMYVHVLGGGNKAVVGTDLFAAIAGLLIVICTTLQFVNGAAGASLSEISQKLVADGNGDLLKATGSYTNPIAFMCLSLSAGVSIVSWPHIFVRSYMAKSEDVFRVMCIAFPFLEWFCFFNFLIQGMYVGRYLYPALEGAASDSVIPMIALEHSPWILAVALVIGVFAFGLSTADSQLVVASSIISHDIMRKEGQKENNTMKQNAIVLTAFMILVVITTYFRPAFLVTYAYSFCAPGFAQIMPAMIGGLYWKKSTKQGALAGVVVGMAVVLFTLFIKNPWPTMAPIGWGIIINTIVFIVVSLATPNDEVAIKEFHEPLDKFFATRNNGVTKFCLAAYAVLYILSHVIACYMPMDTDKLIFGFMSPTMFTYTLTAFLLVIVGVFYAKNRLFEPDGSKKDFAPFTPEHVNTYTGMDE